MDVIKLSPLSIPGFKELNRLHHSNALYIGGIGGDILNFYVFNDLKGWIYSGLATELGLTGTYVGDDITFDNNVSLFRDTGDFLPILENGKFASILLSVDIDGTQTVMLALNPGRDGRIESVFDPLKIPLITGTTAPLSIAVNPGLVIPEIPPPAPTSDLDIDMFMIRAQRWFGTWTFTTSPSRPIDGSTGSVVKWFYGISSAGAGNKLYFVPQGTNKVFMDVCGIIGMGGGTADLQFPSRVVAEMTRHESTNQWVLTLNRLDAARTEWLYDPSDFRVDIFCYLNNRA